MRRFIVHTSNRLEILVDDLARIFRDSPLADPLAQEIVVVQNRGMERWVSQELARRHGVCANVRFPFPNTLFDLLVKGILGEAEEPSPFESTILSWRIMDVLPRMVSCPGFEDVRRYLGDPPDQFKLHQLSRHIADQFDQYILYRPEWSGRWEKGGDGLWQAQLWQTLVREIHEKHRNARREELKKAITAGKPAAGLWPQRISMFGISTLPPFHVDVLYACAQVVQVRFFLLNPCREFWAYAVPESRISRVIRETGDSQAPQRLHLESGNRMLASLGALGREFFDMIEKLEEKEEESRFEDPGQNTLLTMLQSDILDFRNRGENGEEKTRVSPDDRSVQIHACHTPIRELEVLRDVLLDRFEKIPGLKPKDILVMTPDIETYAPAVEAVFGTQADERISIPYRIADRSLGSESEIVRFFFLMIDLAGSRFGVIEVLRLLESPVVRKAFGMSMDDLALIRSWIAKTRIRWAYDADHRRAEKLPGYQENTWKAGFDRLLLGYAMPGQEKTLFEGILPCDDVEGRDGGLLGRWIEAVRMLYLKTRPLAETRSLEEWRQILGDLFDQFVEPDQNNLSDVRAVRQALDWLRIVQRRSGFTEKVKIQVVRSFLEETLNTSGESRTGFLSGGMTFAAMLPMRSIPFRVIALVGMNGDSFPRPDRSPGFDLLAHPPVEENADGRSKNPNPSQRNNDRYLFLEALLSCRDTLVITYTGRSVENNARIPPSVVVSELADALDRSFTIEDRPAGERVTVVHRLQAFHPEYFDGTNPVAGYSGESLRAAQELGSGPKSARPFIVESLSEPEGDWRTVSLDDLGRFFGNPCRFFLEKRLGIRYPRFEDTLEEIEPFVLEDRERRRMGEELIEGKLAGEPTSALLGRIRAAGRLPHGAFGETGFRSLVFKAELFAGCLSQCRIPLSRPPHPFCLELGPWTLEGNLDRLFAHSRVVWRFGKIGPWFLYDAWIRHLVLNSLDDPRLPRQSEILGLKRTGSEENMDVREMGPIAHSREILRTLLDLYGNGLLAPLPFFPRLSMEFAEKVSEDPNQISRALRKALEDWEYEIGNENLFTGEPPDPYVVRCFGGLKAEDVLDENFQRIAMDAAGPLLGALQENGKPS